jgi:tetratricopeptide (TPR) repeat protein
VRRETWVHLILILSACALGAVACRSTNDASAQSRSRRVHKAEEAAYWSEDALERRVRGHAHFAAAVLAESEGKSEVALGHYVQAALEDPLNETLVLQTTGRLLQRRKSAEAVQLLEQCTRLPKPPASYFAWLGLAQMQQGRLDEAAQSNRKALRHAPTLVMAYQNLIAILTEQRRSTEVLGVIRDASRQTSPDSAYFGEVAEMFAGYARLHPGESKGLETEMRAALDRAVELEPKQPLLLHRLAEGYKRLGDVAKAEALYRSMLRQNSGAAFARERLVDLYLRTDNRPQATELLQELVREQPGNERAMYVLGSLAFQDGRFEEAEDLLSKAILLGPTIESAYYELAAVRLTMGRHEEALEVLEKARTVLQKKTFVGEFYSGMAHLRAERYEAATRHFTEAEILAGAGEPERLTHIFYFQFGAASERRGDYEGAALRFRKCLELSPEFAEALNYLGYMWAERGEHLEEARAMIEKAVDLEPDNAAFLDSMGWVLFQLGRSADALPWLEKAVAKSEEPDPTLFDHLGDVLRALGRMEAAQEAWRKAVALKADDRIEKKLDTPIEAPANPP